MPMLFFLKNSGYNEQRAASLFLQFFIDRFDYDSLLGHRLKPFLFFIFTRLVLLISTAVVRPICPNSENNVLFFSVSGIGYLE